MATAVLQKLNPGLHVMTELLHGSHAPFIRPAGTNLNDAQRSAFAFILEEREAARRLVAAYDEATARGIGTIDFEGRMIDGPLLKRAQQVLALPAAEG